MKLVTYVPPGPAADGRPVASRVGLLTDDGIHDLTDRFPGPMQVADVRQLADVDQDTLRRTAEAAASEPGIDPRTVRLRAPLAPGKVIAVGLNYHSHCQEQGRPAPDYPMLFAILPNAVIGPGDAVTRPRATEQLDVECELAVVIGRRSKGIDADEAEAAIFGYTAANDVTARDLQREDRQWLRAKSSDGFAPIGPLVVTADEFRLPVRLRGSVNGELWQDASTDDMIFDVASLVSFASQTVTLEPGDVILTGTPAGVGHFQRPPRYVADGDLMRCEIGGIGVLENPVIDEPGRIDDHAAAAGMQRLSELVP